MIKERNTDDHDQTKQSGSKDKLKTDGNMGSIRERRQQTNHQTRVRTTHTNQEEWKGHTCTLNNSLESTTDLHKLTFTSLPMHDEPNTDSAMGA